MSIAGLRELGPLAFKGGWGISPKANVAGEKVQSWAVERLNRANCRVVRAKPFQLSEEMSLDQELLDECRSGEI